MNLTWKENTYFTDVYDRFACANLYKVKYGYRNTTNRKHEWNKSKLNMSKINLTKKHKPMKQMNKEMSEFYAISGIWEFIYFQYICKLPGIYVCNDQTAATTNKSKKKLQIHTKKYWKINQIKQNRSNSEKNFLRYISDSILLLIFITFCLFTINFISILFAFSFVLSISAICCRNLLSIRYFFSSMKKFNWF